VGPSLLLVDDFRQPACHHSSPRWHRHDHWQVEAMLVGGCTLHHPGGDLALGEGMVAVIRPGVRHGFTYDGTRCAWISIKLRLPEAPAGGGNVVVRCCDPALAAQVEALRLALDGPRPAVAALAAALVWTALPAKASTAPANAVVATAQEVIAAAAGRRLEVESLAARCGISANHLTAVFRQHGLGSPKAAIDRARAARAVELLTRSEEPVGAIAELLEFPDLFTFSRFVRRVTGRPPRSWRQEG
jgi:AraC-like DNA-binding protein